MQREQTELEAPGLDRPGTLIRYGHYGRPVLVFPSEQGRAWDYENNGMVDAVSDLIEAGRVKLYCVDAFDHLTWSDRSVPLEERARRHELYESWITDQVMAAIGADSPGAADIITTGCSLGAFHALNLTLKRADLFPVAICLSGNYDSAAWYPWGERGDAAYFNNPADYLQHLDGEHLDWLRGRALSSWSSVRAPGRRTRPGRCRRPPRPPGCWPRRASRTSSTCGATTSRTTGPGGASRSPTTCPASAEAVDPSHETIRGSSRGADVRYDDLTRQLADVRAAWRSGRLDTAGVGAELARLRTGLPHIEPDRRRVAAYELDAFAEWLTPASRERRTAARSALERVLALSVSPEELVAAARAAIEEIDGIADAAPYADEQDALIQLCEPLELLIEDLEVPA